MKRSPLGRYTALKRFTRINPKRRKPRRNRIQEPAYREWLRRQPCRVPGCARRDIEVAHVGLRGYGIKCPDYEAISLCSIHHRTGKDAHHKLGRKFWDHHKLDRYNTIMLQRGRYLRRPDEPEVREVVDLAA